jgi:hypothetical protein
MEEEEEEEEGGGEKKKIVRIWSLTPQLVILRPESRTL